MPQNRDEPCAECSCEHGEGGVMAEDWDANISSESAIRQQNARLLTLPLHY